MAQTDFFGPVINALVARQRIIESKQQEEARKKQLEQADKRIDLLEKESERRFKQQEDLAKARKLTQGVMLQGLTSELRKEMVGSIMAPAQKQIPGAGQIQQQPLLENILQQRGLASSLPQQDIMVRGQENAPVNLEIPDPETGQPQLRVPIGRTSELIRERGANEAARRQEEQRRLQLGVQKIGLEESVRQQARFPLEQFKANARGLLTDKQIEARAKEGELNRKAAYARALVSARNSGATDPNDVADATELVGLGIRDYKDFGIKDRPAIASALKAQGFNVPSNSAIGVIEKMGQFPVMLDQFDDVLSDLSGNETAVGSAISGAVRRAKNIAVPDEVINKIEEMATGLAAVTKAIKGESGNPSNADIERARNLIPNPSLTAEANARRRKLFMDSFSSAANVGLSSVPVKQRQAIFDHYGVPFTATDVSGKGAEAAPSANTNVWNHPKYGQLNIGEERNIVVNGKPIKAKVAKKSDGSFGWVEVK